MHAAKSGTRTVVTAPTHRRTRSVAHAAKSGIVTIVMAVPVLLRLALRQAPRVPLL